MEGSANIMEWVERLGGWGVLVLIVRWMMTRLDRRDHQMDDMILSLQDSVRTMQRFQEEVADMHNIMTVKIVEMHADVKSMKDAV
jgi:hypothetical protein